MKIKTKICLAKNLIISKNKIKYFKNISNNYKNKDLV